MEDLGLGGTGYVKVKQCYCVRSFSLYLGEIKGEMTWWREKRSRKPRFLPELQVQWNVEDHLRTELPDDVRSWEWDDCDFIIALNKCSLQFQLIKVIWEVLVNVF